MLAWCVALPWHHCCGQHGPCALSFLCFVVAESALLLAHSVQHAWIWRSVRACSAISTVGGTSCAARWQLVPHATAIMCERICCSAVPAATVMSLCLLMSPVECSHKCCAFSTPLAPATWAKCALWHAGRHRAGAQSRLLAFACSKRDLGCRSQRWFSGHNSACVAAPFSRRHCGCYCVAD